HNTHGYKRSPDRCHLICRIPIYDLSGSVHMYYLLFTAGDVLSFDGLKRRHVPHILIGFLMRRSISLFVGPNNTAMIPLPLCRELIDLNKGYPVGRLIIHLRADEEYNDDNLAVMTTLRRLFVRFACDLEFFLRPEWRRRVHSFDYVIIRHGPHFVEDARFFGELKRENPRLRGIVQDIRSRQIIKSVALSATDYALSVFYKRHEFFNYKNLLIKYSHVFALISEVFRGMPNFATTVSEIVRRRSYLQKDVMGMLRLYDPNFSDKVWKPGTYAKRYEPALLREALAAAALHGLMLIGTQLSPREGPETLESVLEPMKLSLIRGRFFEEMTRELGFNKEVLSLAFVEGLYSIERTWASWQNPLIAQRLLSFRFHHGYEKIFAQLLEAIRALERAELNRFNKALTELGIPPGVALDDYEKALLWSNEAAHELNKINLLDFQMVLPDRPAEE
ncbi:MAG: hypothetical protein IAB19_03665, partial [Proteobacteria bacterium]|nr:hypothetical protein [Candidatus Avisuccinivibrio stercorigallinarum]